MEKLVVVVFDLLGPIPWITESLATTEKKEAEKAKKEPTATPRESAKAIIQNPCAKAKKKLRHQRPRQINTNSLESFKHPCTKVGNHVSFEQKTR